MQSGGLPLTKETAAKLDAVMNAKPQGVPTSEWLEAAVISVKRGLPVTAESVKGLQQAVFGPKLHELLTKLETELTLWAQQEGEGEGGKAIGGSEKLAAPSGSAAPSSTGNTGTGLAVAGGELDVDPAAAKAALAASAMPDEAADGAKPAVQSTAAQQTGAGKGEQAAAAMAANTPEAEGINPEAAAKNMAVTAAAVPADNESADAAVLPKAANAAPGSSAEGTDAQNPAARLKRVEQILRRYESAQGLPDQGRILRRMRQSLGPQYSRNERKLPQAMLVDRQRSSPVRPCSRSCRACSASCAAHRRSSPLRRPLTLRAEAPRQRRRHHQRQRRHQRRRQHQR